MALVDTDTGEPRTWEHMRAVVLHRDGYICRICGVASATEVDHIWPRCEGGPTVLRNLQAACSPCNKRKGASVDRLHATAEQLTWAVEYWQAIVDRGAADLAAYDETLGQLAPLMSDDESVTVADAVQRMTEAVAS